MILALPAVRALLARPAVEPHVRIAAAQVAILSSEMGRPLEIERALGRVAVLVEEPRKIPRAGWPI